MSSVADSSILSSGELDQAMIEEPAEQGLDQSAGEVNLIERFDATIHPYIKVSVLLKNDNLGEVPEQFVFSRDFGRIESSQPWQKQDRVVFGRDALSRNRQAPSPIDINLRHNGRVSHEHCQLLLADGWKQRPHLPAQFLEFLKIASRRESIWWQLPRDIYRLIWSMFDMRPKFYIQDLGSKYGTYLKLTAKTVLSQGKMFNVGYDNLFKVVKIEKDVDVKMQAELQEKWASVGLKQLNKIETSEPEQTFSFLIVCLEDYKLKSRQNYVVSCLSGSQASIVVGRQQTNDIVLNHTEVSRRHCRILHQEGRWWLDDGTGESLPSRNGTWLDVRTIDDLQKNKPSTRHPIPPGQQIKIGQTYLKFEVVNND